LAVESLVMMTQINLRSKTATMRPMMLMTMPRASPRSSLRRERSVGLPQELETSALRNFPFQKTVYNTSNLKVSQNRMTTFNLLILKTQM